MNIFKLKDTIIYSYYIKVVAERSSITYYNTTVFNVSEVYKRNFLQFLTIHKNKTVPHKYIICYHKVFKIFILLTFYYFVGYWTCLGSCLSLLFFPWRRKFKYDWFLWMFNSLRYLTFELPMKSIYLINSIDLIILDG